MTFPSSMFGGANPSPPLGPCTPAESPEPKDYYSEVRGQKVGVSLDAQPLAGAAYSHVRHA